MEPAGVFPKDEESLQLVGTPIQSHSNLAVNRQVPRVPDTLDFLLLGPPPIVPSGLVGVAVVQRLVQIEFQLLHRRRLVMVVDSLVGQHGDEVGDWLGEIVHALGVLWTFVLVSVALPNTLEKSIVPFHQQSPILR